MSEEQAHCTGARQHGMVICKDGQWDEKLFEALAGAAGCRISEFTAQELANRAWAFAKMGQWDEKLFEELARATENWMRLCGSGLVGWISYSFLLFPFFPPPGAWPWRLGLRAMHELGCFWRAACPPLPPCRGPLGLRGALASVNCANVRWPQGRRLRSGRSPSPGATDRHNNNNNTVPLKALKVSLRQIRTKLGGNSSYKPPGASYTA